MIDRAAYPWTPLARETNAGRQAYVDEGRMTGREVVLFVHGTPSWSYEWRHLIKALAPRYRCIAPDHIGFGHSARPVDWRYALDDHRSNLRELLRNAQVERFHLVVHDFGGPIALPLAIEAPERLLSLTLMNTWLWDLGTNVDKALARFLYLRCNFSARFLLPLAWGKRRKLDRATHRAYYEMFPTRESRLGTWAFAQALSRERAEMERYGSQLAELRGVKTLIAWGTADCLIKPVHLARWRQELPQAKVLEIDGAGHWPQEEAPEEIAKALHAHLA